MDEKFIITPKTEASVTVTVRIKYEVNKQLEEISIKSGRSRNEIINKALMFAFDRMELEEKEYPIKILIAR